MGRGLLARNVNGGHVVERDQDPLPTVGPTVPPNVKEEVVGPLNLALVHDGLAPTVVFLRDDGALHFPDAAHGALGAAWLGQDLDLAKVGSRRCLLVEARGHSIAYGPCRGQAIFDALGAN